jgi:hypothetical protein
MASQAPERKTLLGNRVVDVYSDSGDKIGEIVKSDGLFGEKTEYHKFDTSYSGSSGDDIITKFLDLVLGNYLIVGIATGVLVFFLTLFAGLNTGGAIISGLVAGLIGPLVIYMVGSMLIMAAWFALIAGGIAAVIYVLYLISRIP